ncbi:MAG: neuraminidase-like domain-containing protein, partial [Nitrososphaera sp.]
LEEPDVIPAAIDAERWKWMKNYRVWEANRKIFLYPGNWIEEGLRDNKSPFFKKLESELLQNDLTMETAENAFLNYLEKLDQVARLEISGMYLQQESESMPGENDKVDTIHVFGRMFHIPHLYFYRQLDRTISTWTPWEKVPVDIQGDHLIPVVWNRRLHIFWPIFTEKAVEITEVTSPKIQEPITNPDGSVTVPPPSGSRQPSEEKAIKKYWEIQIAWSEYKNSKWSAKQLSSEFLISKYVRGFDDATPERHMHTFKALFESNGVLTIQMYFQHEILGEFRFTGCQGRVNIRYVRYADSTYDWLNISEINPPGEVIRDDRYRQSFLLRPEGSDVFAMTFREWEDPAAGTLTLISGSFGGTPTPAKAKRIDVPSLDKTPSTYRLLYPHQYYQFALQAPFFYEDDLRTYFVTPEEGYGPITQVVNPSLTFIPNEVL